MDTFVDRVLNPKVYRDDRTRAERIEELRRDLAKEKAADREINRSYVTNLRRDLTRQALYLRVEQGEPLACLRWQWIQRARGHREKIYGWDGLRNCVTRRVEYLDARRERLALGTITKGRNKGKPYSAVTVQNLRREIAYSERELAEAEPQIAAFLASAPPPYHVWRRQQKAPTAARGGAKAPSRVKASGNVIDFAEARKRKGEPA
jgi:hypothetical protein